MIILHKLIPLLISPLAVFFLLAVIGWLTRTRWLTAIAFLVLLVASNPLVARYTTALLERDYPPVEMSSLPESDAFVVLSGMMKTLQMPDGAFVYEFRGAVDRFFAALDAVRKNKVKQLVFTRGQLPWVKGMPEGEVLKARAVALGVPENIIKLTALVENTEDEAKAVRTLLGQGRQRIVLVTSAYHMARAVRLFENQGFEVVPFPVDFQGDASEITLLDFLPSALALQEVTLFEREMIGRLYYALRESVAPSPETF